MDEGNLFDEIYEARRQKREPNEKEQITIDGGLFVANLYIRSRDDIDVLSVSKMNALHTTPDVMLLGRGQNTRMANGTLPHNSLF